MAVNFVKPGSFQKPPQTATPGQPPAQQQKSGPSWLKTGADSAAIAQKEQARKEVEQAKREAEWGKLRRFFMERNSEAEVTFVDGDLSHDGYLIPPRWYEHLVRTGPKDMSTFVCPELTNPDSGDTCPLCESGDKASLVAAFTIIDHRSWTDKNGKVWTDQRKLLIVKSKTFETLNKIAQKVGGLAGMRFMVQRSNSETSPNVGDNWAPLGKSDPAELYKQYMATTVDPKTKEAKVESAFRVADYEHEIVFLPGDELRKLGLGAPSGVSKPAAGPSQTPWSGGSTDYSNQL